MEMTEHGVSSPPKKSKSRFSLGSTYKRNRKETKFDIGEMAHDLRGKIARYVMNENYVPKRWRPVDGLPAIGYARTIRDLCIRANDIDLNSPDFPKRMEMERDVLGWCHVLELSLMDIISDCAGATDENMSEITDALDTLYGKIDNWIKANQKTLDQKETANKDDKPSK